MKRLQLPVSLMVGLTWIAANVTAGPVEEPATEAPVPDSAALELERLTQRQRILESGWQAYQQGDQTAALTAYQEALRSSPDDATLWYDVGCLQALEGKTIEAKESLRQAIGLNPKLATAHDALGQLEEQDGNLEAALAAYRTASDLEPEQPKFSRRLARIYFRLKDEPMARAALLQVVRYDSTDAESRYQLGVLELRAKAPNIAINDFQKAVELDPKHVLAWNGLGLAYARVGRFEEATMALRQARSLEPNNPRTETNIGVVAAGQERWEDARRAWERALRADPAFTPAEQNLEMLESLLTLPAQ